ncbi:alpha/beta fold hydrolase [Paenibacillus sacheonensis]|uniref:Alpha/beta fold hydrolase n=1 Tax=Paenibacillus sacheonensis TaxID=742054 RepID=A0A7X5BXB5_9BACL|nr:alpha/beta hydrolase [Paenibacillus sacheonensis]MBM7568759.1 pimeloyl-ACP methyl ester carboxylesterase [Paenibacillus sacheonensis]NBC68402.1 alpha/beta fold hydrolase [Paenibacillus sacheonensis]
MNKHVINKRLLGGALIAFSLVQAVVPSTTHGQAAEGHATKLGILAKLETASQAPTFATIKQIKAGGLNMGYVDEGPRKGPAVILLHGWPYDIHSYFEVLPRLTKAGYRVIIPYARGFGTTSFLDPDAQRNAEPAALASDVVALMDALKIDKAILGGYDWGARSADIVAALWPERVKGLVAVSGYLISGQEAGKRPLPPEAEQQWWYQFYFATERGREGYQKNLHDFAKLIWKNASPKWNFDDRVFERSAEALKNPDQVPITISNYRWRLGLIPGEPRYAALEARLAESPPITVPTITMEGDANGAPHPAAADYAKYFTGKYKHVIVRGGIGHNLPQEAPEAFADAIIEVDHL